MTEKLNCRPGDLAVLIKSKLGQQGVILKCERLLRDGDIVGGVRFCVANNAPPVWIVDRVLRVQKKEDGLIMGLMVCYDDILRPIRDQPGDDETFRWAGKPEHYALIQRARRPFFSSFAAKPISLSVNPEVAA